MKELNIDVQVLYPTLFLRTWTRDPQFEYAICRAYNRWLADVWKAAPDKLKWVVMLPLMSMDRIKEEMRFGKEHGAVGVYLRGLECERELVDSYFYPLYQLGQDMDMPMCFHSGNGSFAVRDVYKRGGLGRGKLPVVAAFHQLVASNVPAMFPKLRWGFVEVSAQWIPYALNDLEIRLLRKGKRLPATTLADNRMYVACQMTDDLDYILPMAGENQLVIGTDYGHADTSTEIEALRLVRDKGNLTPGVVDKILNDNAAALYGL